MNKFKKINDFIFSFLKGKLKKPQLKLQKLMEGWVFQAADLSLTA